MNVFQSIEELQMHIRSLKHNGKLVGFVPTMGNLHQGHLSLIKEAKKHCDYVVASIFVNPLQFGANEDLDSYPRTLDADKEKLTSLQTDALFLPNTEIIYPNGLERHTKVTVEEPLTNKLCGASRPGHFLGVTTVVNILFNIVQPDVAVFGKKDFQQFKVIEKMVSDLRMPIELIGGAIVREPNGLAMSSRNGYLSQEKLDDASHLRATIVSVQKQIEGGDKNYKSLERYATRQLEHDGFKVDYFSIVNQHTLEPAKQNDSELLIAAAAWFGQPRLIDNQEVYI